MSTIYSKYLGTSFETDYTEVKDGTRELILIPHNSLEDIIHNQLPETAKIAYDYEVFASAQSYALVSCTMCDASGRRIVAFGEATPKSLTTTIARLYPGLMATQRAFDRAAIRFLGLPEKVYSETEIDKGEFIPEPEDVPAAIVEQSVAPVETPVPVPVPAPAPVPVSAPVPKKAAISVKEEKPVEDAKPVSAPVATQASEIDYGTVVIDAIGKYRGKGKTVAEIAAEDRSWLEYIARMTAPREPMKTQVEAAARYLENNQV